jgi:hypothetical protein
MMLMIFLLVYIDVDYIPAGVFLLMIFLLV